MKCTGLQNFHTVVTMIMKYWKGFSRTFYIKFQNFQGPIGLSRSFQVAENGHFLQWLSRKSGHPGQGTLLFSVLCHYWLDDRKGIRSTENRTHQPLLGEPVKTVITAAKPLKYNLNSSSSTVNMPITINANDQLRSSTGKKQQKNANELQSVQITRFSFS